MLQRNSITSIGDGLKHTRKLTTLSLDSNQLKLPLAGIPPSVTVLSISSNKLVSLKG